MYNENVTDAKSILMPVSHMAFYSDEALDFDAFVHLKPPADISDHIVVFGIPDEPIGKFTFLFISLKPFYLQLSTII
jgi:hypothetical protein